MIDLRLALFFADGHRVPAPEGPGWYLYSTDGERGEVIPRVRLTGEEALKFAKVVDNFTNGKPLNWTPNTTKASHESFAAAVAANNEAAKELVRSELKEAERAVKNLELLKKRAEEFGIDG